MFSYMAGPDEIQFNLHCRTYRHRTGLLWLPLHHAGSFEDIVGFHIHEGSKQSRRGIYWLSVILDRRDRILPLRD